MKLIDRIYLKSFMNEPNYEEIKKTLMEMNKNE